MGILLSLPLAGTLGTLATSCLAGTAFFCSSKAASLFCKSCNCNSSIATRIGFAVIFSMNATLAFLMKTEVARKYLEKWTQDYNRMDCAGGECYSNLAIHRICFALMLFHTILSLLLLGVNDTKNKRAAIQNGWWGPKVFAWLVLLVVSFFIPNGFFIFWGNWISLIGASFFILLGLVLLVDFAHSWSEMCLENWENSESNFWQFILLGSTAAMYIGTITLTGIMYGFFASEPCTLNRFFISFNLALCIICTIACIHPVVQESNPRSGLAQASMVTVYCTYLIMSAVVNRTKQSDPSNICNPLRASGTKQTTVVLGAIFTFLAIAYSTSRAATQSKALVGNKKRDGAISLGSDGDSGHNLVVNSQPGKSQSPRYQAMLAAVEAGAIPASALQQYVEDEDDDDDATGPSGEERDDERTGTRYNYAWFHVIFVLGCMYVGMLLTDWQFISTQPPSSNTNPHNIYIGQSVTSMWMRVISSWLCILLYLWSLLAPVVMPDRFGE